MIYLLFVLTLAGGAAAGYYLPSSNLKLESGSSKKRLEEAKKEAHRIKEEAKGNADKIRHAIKEEAHSLQENFQEMEKLLSEKESLVKRREDRNKSFEGNVKKLEDELAKLEKERKSLLANAVEKLSAASGLDKDSALKQARQELEDVITEGREQRAEAELNELQDDIARHAKAVLQLVIQRLGVQSSVDKNSTYVVVKQDSFKGMLVGKGGKNIAYFESILPVSILFNHFDSKHIYVGGLNLLRRHVAKRAIEKLQKWLKKEKTITFPLIDKAVEEANTEVMEICDRKGAWACKQMGINPKEVPDKLVNYVGRMYFRTSYGQNIIHHSLEMAFAARLIAELIGSDVNKAMLAAFYHDIGKAIDHDIGGAHDDISKDILEEYGFDEDIVHAAYAHHDKVPCEKPADFIVKAVDAISGGRPGARMESVFNYFERMKELENAAKAFDGVRKVFTMSAGREVRVMVDRDKINDTSMDELAEKIADNISENVAFPGIIKVNLIRRTKSVDYAREQKRR